MSKIVLTHGFNGAPKIYDWLKAELEVRGFEVILPSFPPREGVVYEKWAEVLDRYDLDEDSVVVCHSIGNEFLIKYLVERNLRVRVYIGLAGFAEKFANEGKDILNKAVERFWVSEEERRKFVLLAGKRFAIYSDNDHVVPFEVLERYPAEVEAEPILIPGIGHMGRKSGMCEFPELLELILKIENDDD